MTIESQKPGQAGTTETDPRIDGYEILERVGEGGTSSVWKARQVSLQRLVVIKVLSEQFTQSVADIKQFSLEARLAANLKHSGIVQVYDFGQFGEGRRYYFVMEYVSGYSVGEWMRRKQILPESDALVVVHSVASALRYAWDSAHVVHCDLKPDNIMVDGDGTIKLTDLGLAQVVSNIGLAAGRQEEFIAGTPNYMSPEQVRGDVKLDCRSDIYSLGMTLFHMLTGQLPFVGVTPEDVMDKQISEPLPPIRQVNPAVSPGAAQLVARMTAKLPDDRHQTWDAVLEDVSALENSATKPSGPAPASAPAPVPASAPVPAPKPVPKPAPKTTPSVCRYCGGGLRANAAFCRHCGKTLADIPGTSGAAAEVRLRVPAPKPMSRAASSAPSRAMKQGGVKFSRQRVRALFSNIMGNLRMLISIALLGFIGYCTYQQFVNGRDVLWPLRVKIRRVYKDVWNKMRLSVSDLFQSQPTSVEPGNKDADAWLPSPEAPSASEPALSARPIPERAPSYSDDRAPKPEPAQDREYAQLLDLCRSSVPRVGETVAIDLQHQERKREGVLREIGQQGLVLQVESGQLTVPYNVMTPEYRLQFFPEERARLLLQSATRKL